MDDGEYDDDSDIENDEDNDSDYEMRSSDGYETDENGELGKKANEYVHYNCNVQI
jgi:hypothetical protein